nr:MAG TPA: Vta1-like protein [Caudoviricetes sp.]
MLAESRAVYDIINEPEDIEQRHKYCKFKVKRVKGGA